MECLGSIPSSAADPRFLLKQNLGGNGDGASDWVLIHQHYYVDYPQYENPKFKILQIWNFLGSDMRPQVKKFHTWPSGTGHSQNAGAGGSHVAQWSKPMPLMLTFHLNTGCSTYSAWKSSGSWPKCLHPCKCSPNGSMWKIKKEKWQGY